MILLMSYLNKVKKFKILLQKCYKNHMKKYYHGKKYYIKEKFLKSYY